MGSRIMGSSGSLRPWVVVVGVWVCDCVVGRWALWLVESTPRGCVVHVLVRAADECQACHVLSVEARMTFRQ